MIAREQEPAGISTGQLARALGKQQTELSMIRRALIEEHHLLRASARGYVVFAFPRFQLWLQEQLASPQATDGFEGLVPSEPRQQRSRRQPRSPRLPPAHLV